MFGFVKSWLRQTAWERTVAEVSAQPRWQAARPARAVAPAANASPADTLELPLCVIYSQLPADLQTRVRVPAEGEAQVSVPLAIILAQLGRGSVKVTFGELRQMAGEGLFDPQTDRDTAVVELPLAEIFARLNPAALPRRAQSQVTVADEITSPFSENGRGLNLYKPEPTPGTAFIRKIDDSPAVPVFPARGAIKSVPPVPFPSADSPPLFVRKDVPSPATRVLVQSASQPANGSGGVLAVTLAALAAGWREAVRAEIAQMNLSQATVALPLALMEESLKRGKAMFTWKQIRSWTDSPTAAQAASAHDAELMELPLEVLAPLFLGKERNGQSAKKIQVDQNIPDLFNSRATTAADVPIAFTNGHNHAAPAPVYPKPAAQTVAPAPVVNTGFNLAEAQGKARMAENGTIRSGTEFLRRTATPNDIVAKAVRYEGVAGALIMLPDGLLVASNLPANVNGDSLAAFLQQMFARVGQSTREFRMGELRHLNFTVGNVPWEIFKVGAIYFAAFGEAEATLPTADLAALAAELDRKPK